MSKNIEYVVEGAKVKCSQGSAETTLKATANSMIGNQLRIIETDTTPASFEGTFGNCKRRKGEPCVMVNLPIWFNTNADFVSGSGKPCVTKESFAVCITGAGAIQPADSGQIFEQFEQFDNINDNPDTGLGVAAAGGVVISDAILGGAISAYFLSQLIEILKAVSSSKNNNEAQTSSDEANSDSLPNQGTVKGDVEGAPPVDAGKQGKHVPGHNNNDSSKSQWPEGQTGVHETQQGWMEGTELKDGTKVWDSGRVIGKNGETGVRVHKDYKGNIHGYPVDSQQYLP